MVRVFFAHPYPDRSRANHALAEAARDVEGVSVRSLYDVYPDFAIDVTTEQALLVEADAVVFQHPLHWYAAPALLHLWFEKVLTAGWAFGHEGNALEGKRCLWAVTTGGDEDAYTEAGIHQHTFDSFVPAMRQTAQLCKMRFEPPFIVHGARRLSDTELARTADRYQDRLRDLVDGVRDAP